MTLVDRTETAPTLKMEELEFFLASLKMYKFFRMSRNVGKSFSNTIIRHSHIVTNSPTQVKPSHFHA